MIICSQFHSGILLLINSHHFSPTDFKKLRQHTHAYTHTVSYKTVDKKVKLLYGSFNLTCYLLKEQILIDALQYVSTEDTELRDEDDSK